MTTLKNWCFLLLLGFAAQGFSQGTSALERVDSLTQLGEYKNAIRVTEDFLETRPRNFALSLAYFQLSKAYLKLGDLVSAKDYNKESQSIKERIAYEYFADNLMQAGLIEQAAGNTTAAMDYYQEAANLPHETVIFSAQLERNIGLAHLDLGDLEKAEERVFNTIDLLKWEVGDMHIELAHTYVALGRVQTKRGTLREAVRTFTVAKTVLETLNLMDNPASEHFYDALVEWFLVQEGQDQNNKETIDFGTLRSQLTDQEALLIYRLEGLYYVALGLSKTEQAVILEDYSRKMRQTNDEQKSYDLLGLSKAAFVEQANEYYNFFITPMSSVLDQTKRTTIIKYGALEKLAFAALLRNPVSASSGYTDMEFLGKYYAIDYESGIAYDFTKALSGRLDGYSNLRFSEDFPQKYKRKVKKQYRKYLKGHSKEGWEEAIHLTRKWMMGRKGMAEPMVWLGVY